MKASVVLRPLLLAPLFAGTATADVPGVVSSASRFKEARIGEEHHQKTPAPNTSRSPGMSASAAEKPRAAQPPLL